MRHPPMYQQAQNYPALRDRELLAALWPGGGGAGPTPAKVNNAMQVSIPPGWLAVPLQSGQGSVVCRWDASEVVPIDTEGTGNQRWDAITALVRDPDLDGGANNDFVFSVIKGTPAASSPVIPPVPANSNQALVALVLVTGGQANLNSATLLDRRPLGHCEVHQAASQGLPNTAYSTIFFDTVDAGAGWNFGAYTCPMAGVYRVTAIMTMDRSVTMCGLQVKRGATEVGRGPAFATPAGWGNAACNMVVDVPGCAAGDTLTILGLTGPAANTYTANPTYTSASFRYLGP